MVWYAVLCVVCIPLDGHKRVVARAGVWGGEEGSYPSANLHLNASIVVHSLMVGGAPSSASACLFPVLRRGRYLPKLNALQVLSHREADEEGARF